MTLRDLFKRTQVRLAALLTLLFTLGVGVLFAVLVLSADEEMEEGIRSRVLRTRDALLTIDRRYGFDELVSVVTDEAESVRDADSIFLLLGPDGKVQAGNVTAVDSFEDWRVIERKSIPSIAGEGHRQDRFYAIWSPVSKGQLLVGRSDREARQLQLILLQSLGWGLISTAAFAIGAGVYLARRAQRRIDAIGTTLTAVSSGQLDRRVPVEGASDDLGQVSLSINDMLSQLETLVQNVNQSSTDIAHDLKRPMTRLRQKLETASEGRLEASNLKSVIEESLEEIDAIVSTFDALLNIGQLETGDRRARFADVDLTAVIATVVEAYEPVIQDSGFRLAVEIEDREAPAILGDQELLVQMLANLVENALRHCPKGTLITLALAREDGRSVVSITDNGPGIPLQERQNVFRRFYRLERARSSPGHGLGLNLVGAIAELHRASITLEDNAPGLKVKIVFPERVR